MLPECGIEILHHRMIVGHRFDPHEDFDLTNLIDVELHDRASFPWRLPFADSQPQ
jgi:hypothetical protein